MQQRNPFSNLALVAIACLLAAAPLSEAPALAQEAAPDAPETAPSEAEVKNPRVVLEIRGLHYDAGAPVRVRVSAHNEGEEGVKNPLTNPIAQGLYLKDSAGKTYRPEEPGTATPQEQPSRLGAGAYFGQVVDVARHFTLLSDPGKYTLSYGEDEDRSNEVVLNIIPAFHDDSTYTAVIKTAMGEMTIELYLKDAPRTVRNFVDLARQGFYEGLEFHYARPGDMIMGGDPTREGTGGSGFFVPAEFSDRKHLAGTVGMVRGSDINSASSQFYICLSPQPERDGLFTAFGQVVEGMDVLTRLGEVPTSGRNQRPFFRPLEPLVIESITIQETPAAEAGS
jgi:cyclophilin family peptidyl-prolyl cis-trans isomerase